MQLIFQSTIVYCKAIFTNCRNVITLMYTFLLSGTHLAASLLNADILVANTRKATR